MNGFPARRIVPIIGLAIGLASGLVYTWVVAPVELVNTYPALLRTDYRHDWVRLVALSYVADGDIERAQARLEGLKRQDVADAIKALIEEYAAAGYPADTLRSLTALAEALDMYTPAMLVYLYTLTPSLPVPVATFPPTPTPTATAQMSPSAPPTSSPGTSPTTTPTRKPTRTPRPPTATPSPRSPFQLARQEQICEPGQPPRIEIVVRDERGVELAGVEVWLMWPGGADRAVTGLKPEYGPGYADFNAERDINYTLGVSELGMPLVTDLQITNCPTQKGKETFLGSWRIVLEQSPTEVD